MALSAHPPIASARAFRVRYTAWSALPGSVGALLVVGYFAAVLDLGDAGWRTFGSAVALLIALALPYGQWMQRRAERDITRALDGVASGDVTREELQRAYVAALALPRRGTRIQVSNYGFAALLCPLWMALFLPDTSAFTLFTITAGALTGGAACLPFCLWAMARFIAPTRDWFAEKLSPEERRQLAPASSLAAKLALPMGAVSAATVTFLCLLGLSVALRLLEEQDVRVKAAFLRPAAGALARGHSLRELRVTAREREVARELLVVGRDGTVLAGPSGALSHTELAWLRSHENESRSSLGLDSPTSFAWWAIPGESDRLLVAQSPIRKLVGDLSGTLAVVALVLAGVSTASLAVALLVAADTRRIARRLREEAERVGAGDLRPGDVIESDDELGGVAHAFAQMASSLARTLTRVRETSARAEAAAQGLVQIGGALREVTVAQVRGIEGAQSAVAAVHRQAGQITSSAQTLVGSVEDASSSVLELGAASEELSQTTVALSSQVEAVGSSIEQMVASVARAGDHTEALGGAVLETTSSVAEMVRSMRSVDGHALETARLGTRVIELAEGGRERVQETIRSMEAIRDATDAAQRLIDGLAARMQEIGAIIGVIDDVADETNLLALNAAIIAAQAGEHGRAFSVVADEIKDLADRVLASTKEIGGLIRSVQDESVSAAAAIQQGADSVQGGVGLSAQAGVALEDITGAARHAGERLQEIVGGMREQTRAAGHVEGLIAGVGQRLQQIREAGREQARGNEVVMRGSLVMRDVAHQTRRTTEEQTRGAERIRDSIEGVRDAVERIHVALQRQSESCQSAVSSLGDVIARTRTNDEATDRLAGSAQELQALADALRADMQRFRLE